MRRWAFGLALLALIVQVLAPSGFMVARQGDHAAIVICTGHGPARSLSDLAHPGKAPQSRHEATCAFAGLGVGATAPLMALIVRPISLAAEAASLVRFDLVPGRGLAAPPPPSHAPPAISI